MLISNSNNDRAIIEDDNNVKMEGQCINLKQSRYNGLGFDGNYSALLLYITIYYYLFL